jgi:hypothetical protein
MNVSFQLVMMQLASHTSIEDSIPVPSASALSSAGKVGPSGWFFRISFYVTFETNFYLSLSLPVTIQQCRTTTLSFQKCQTTARTILERWVSPF